MNTRFAIIALSASALALGACKKEPPESLPPQPLPSTASNTPATDPNAGMSGPGTQTHFEQMVNGQNVIFFDTDRYNIDSADAAALQMQARYLAQYPNVTVTVEGHADERGTREYNLALGDRRANSAKNYLVARGVSPSRITTISYGKERPLALGSDEESYAQNRRAVTVVLN